MDELPVPSPRGAMRAMIPVDRYNYRHYGLRHLLGDAVRNLRGAGLRPGEPAPDFELPRSDGGSVRLGDRRGRPVLLRFGSFT
jgi:hypothetical protein